MIWADESYLSGCLIGQNEQCNFIFNIIKIYIQWICIRSFLHQNKKQLSIKQFSQIELLQLEIKELVNINQLRKCWMLKRK
ncbi:unnamed protein product [Paramecium octaurelia]|uniref:Uncharacterized protein n=1 Tax=Paramecium octaurelia TaxID=43137 RepID=A0A8S1XME3_PAROT|nr:unnamed protein product [Paramecium octaurelia]